VERNRTPLEELRQAAEDQLSDSPLNLRKTGCLGPCGEGHMMGIAEEGEGVYLFKQMNDRDVVESLARTAAEFERTGHCQIPHNLRSHLEAKLSPRSIPEIPFES